MTLRTSAGDDARCMAAAVALGTRARGLSSPNPNVGCLLVRDGHVIARGWTQPGGRPHAEGMALDHAAGAARGATAYVTLEPCTHRSPRGAACADALIDAGVTRVVVATTDPDLRTNGRGIRRLLAAGVMVEVGVCDQAARTSMAGWFTRTMRGRPHVTLKLAVSLDGCIAMASGESRWITGGVARAYAHLLRARADAILVGRGTYEADAPALDVRLTGLEHRSPRRIMLTRAGGVDGWDALSAPADIATLVGVNDLLVEGGAGAASAFLRADLIDTLILIRAPILIGAGRAMLGDIGLGALGDAHDRWRLADVRGLGQDRVERYERTRKE